MEQEQRAKLLEGMKILNLQFEESVAKVRVDLESGMPVEDVLAGGVTEFAKADPGYLASVIVARLIKEARKPVRKTRSTSVPAKRPRAVREVPDVSVG